MRKFEEHSKSIWTVLLKNANVMIEWKTEGLFQIEEY